MIDRLKMLEKFCLFIFAAAILSCSGNESEDTTPERGDQDVETPDLEIPESCNPLAYTWDCLLPYPSDFFLQPDDDLPGGKRVVIPPEADVITDSGNEVAPFEMFPADGFSHAPQILAYFPYEIEDSILPSMYTGYESSVAKESPTVLIEADSGRFIPHFSELDAMAKDATRQALVLRPMIRLENGTRYIVAIQGLKDTTGNLLPAPEGFRILRDNLAGEHAVLSPLSARYESDVFPGLEQAGLERTDLQLAWDFTTQTMENVAGHMLEVREAVIERMQTTPPPSEITEDRVTASEENVWRRLEGTFTGPLYTEEATAMTRLHRDASGTIVENGDVQIPFSVLIPACLETWSPGDTPVRAIQYGHGFFGDRSEIERDWLSDFATTHCFIVFTVDMWGMMRPDSVGLGGLLMSEPAEALSFTDRLPQGMANHIMMTYAIRDTLPLDSAFKVEGELVYDPTQIYYYGNSQGGILGGMYTALSPLISRYVLGVGGGPFTLIMFRSQNFGPFLGMMEMQVSDPLDIQKWSALFSNAFDRIDPVTYAPLAMKNPLEETLEKKVLMQIGIGDTSVGNLASHMLARTLGVKLLKPAVREVPGLDPLQAPADDSALVEFDFGVDPTITELPRIPTESTPAHEGPRRQEEANLQINAFLKLDGQIKNFCNDSCDPD